VIGVKSPLHQLPRIVANKQRKLVQTPGYVNHLETSVSRMLRSMEGAGKESRLHMNHKIYRASPGYWVRSTLVVATLLLIPLILVGGIPGFPHLADSAAEWHMFYASRPYEGLSLGFIWLVTVVVFSYFAIRALRALLRPVSLRGILEEVDATNSAAKRIGALQVSGVRHCVRYDKGLFNLLESQKTINCIVEIKVGVGDRVIYVDEVKEEHPLSSGNEG
jgi:hypothetical protein